MTGKYGTFGSMIPTRSPGSTPFVFSNPATCALAPSRNLYGSSASSSLMAIWSPCSAAVSVRTVARLRLMLGSSLRGCCLLLATAAALLLRRIAVLVLALLALLQLLLQDLAGRVARQLVHELDVLGHLVAREIRLHLRLDLILRRAAAPLRHDERLQPLAELLVVDADHGHLVDALHVRDQVLDLAREHVLAARDDHVVVAAGDVQAALLVEVADVAGRHQPVDHVLVAAAGVALEQHLVAHEDAAGLALRQLLAVLVVDLQDGAARRGARGARRLAQILRRGDRRPGDLGRAVEVVEDVTEFVHELDRELAG